MFLVVPNFIVFWVISVCVGGDALNGFIHDGHYFICAHGACHEVSRDFWIYSYWHAISAMGGIMLIFIEAAVLVTLGDIVLDFNQKVHQ
jgi:hypothetical protein